MQTPPPTSTAFGPGEGAPARRTGEDAPARPAVSIVIVNWNTRDLLRDCLASIAAETRKPHQTIVVDNASTDGSTDMVREEFPGVVLIANRKNAGFARANNQGIAVTTGAHVLLLNPDTVILDGAIDTMLDWIAARPDVGCASCQVRETETVLQRTCFADMSPWMLLLSEAGLPRLLPHSRIFGAPEYAWWDRCSEREVDVVSGMFMLVPRPVLETVGGLDEAFFVYAEEADWCKRIRNAGYRCVFTPVARILHVHGGGKSTAQIKTQMYVQMQKSKMIYVAKHYGRAGNLAARSVFLGSMGLRLASFALLGALTGSADAKACARLALAALRFHLLGYMPVS